MHFDSIHVSLVRKKLAERPKDTFDKQVERKMEKKKVTTGGQEIMLKRVKASQNSD